MLSFKTTFSLSSFIFIKRLFSSSLSAIRVVSSAYLRLLIFLLAVLIPACASSSPAFRMMYSAYKINKQGDNMQRWQTPFPIWNQCVVPCPGLLVADAFKMLPKSLVSLLIGVEPYANYPSERLSFIWGHFKMPHANPNCPGRAGLCECWPARACSFPSCQSTAPTCGWPALPRIICSLFPFLLSYRRLTHFQWVVNESERQGCCWPIPRRYPGRQVNNLVSLFSQDLPCLIKGPVTTYFSPRIFLLLRGAHLSGI